jgi:hypothetical protein
MITEHLIELCILQIDKNRSNNNWGEYFGSVFVRMRGTLKEDQVNLGEVGNS